MPIATRRVKSGVTAKSVSRMAVGFHASLTFPLASCQTREKKMSPMICITSVNGTKGREKDRDIPK